MTARLFVLYPPPPLPYHLMSEITFPDVDAMRACATSTGDIAVVDDD